MPSCPPTSSSPRSTLPATRPPLQADHERHPASGDGYDGVVITDALGMQGVRDKYGDERVPVLALKAGVDMLLMPPDLDLAYNAVLDAVRSRELTPERINTSVKRILRLKWELGLVDAPYVDVLDVPNVVGTAAHRAAAQDLTDRTTTLVKNDGDVLPLTPGSDQDVLVTGWGAGTPSATSTIATKMQQRGATTQVFETGANPSGEQITASVAAAEANDVTVVASYRAWQDTSAGQRELVRRLTATGKPVIAVAVSDAYDIAYYPEVSGLPRDVQLDQRLAGVAGTCALRRGEPAGKLPVTIPTADDPDTALHPFGHGLDN
ncbi:MAG: glycoside hydrolase family 3 N-terminal domain-containing protein [Nocardioidaceae bacterium]